MAGRRVCRRAIDHVRRHWRRETMTRREAWQPAVATLATFAMLAAAASAHAQSGSSGTSTAASSSAAQTQSAPAKDTRPATPTFTGDTGLWFAPTAEVLPSGKLSVSGY